MDTRQNLGQVIAHPPVVLAVYRLRLRRKCDAKPVNLYDVAYLSRLGDDDYIVFLVVAVEPRLGAVLIRYDPLGDIGGEYRI